MSIATLTSQNQITIPSKVRRLLSIEAGDKIKFLPSNNQDVRIVKLKKLESLKGIFKSYDHGQDYDPHAVWLSRPKLK